MQSRYDVMKAGSTSDSFDNQVYPDTLSANFGNFTYTQPPYIVIPNYQLELKPYLFCYSYYGVAAYEDIIFNINNVLHISLLSNYSQIDFPTLSDLNSFLATPQG
jgi:hypothetical protein